MFQKATCLALALLMLVCTCATAEVDMLTALTQGKTTQYFTDDPVPVEDIQTILLAGSNAQSGLNRQPWHFTAIANADIMEQVVSSMTKPASMATGGNAKAQFGDSPLAIGISVSEGQNLAGGLSCDHMASAAMALGYGVKIVATGANAFNDNRELLGIPEEMSCVAVLLIGVEDTSIDMTADGVTGPSARVALDEVATIFE